MQETPECNDPLISASTAPEILLALITALNMTKLRGVAISDIVKLIPPFDEKRYIRILDNHNDDEFPSFTEHDFTQILIEKDYAILDRDDDAPVTDDVDEPEEWMAQASHRLFKLITRRYRDIVFALSVHVAEKDRDGALNEFNDFRRTISFVHSLRALYNPVDTSVFIETFVAIHNLWTEVERKYPGKFKHPLAPIVEECLTRYVPKVEPETRRKNILPEGLSESHHVPGELFPIGKSQPPSKTLLLPGIEPWIGTQSNIVPALPLEVYKSIGGKSESPGLGAPLAQRIWIYCIASTPLRHRNSIGVNPTITLRRLTKWAYPNGWNRNRQLPLIRSALHEVHNFRIAWNNVERNLVRVLDLPTLDTPLDQALELQVSFPEGMAAQGPLIDMTILSHLGVKSAPQFRAYLRLAYLWDEAKKKNNGHRVFAQRPKVKRNNRGQAIDAKGGIIPKNNWNHPKAVWTDELEDNPAAERVDSLTDIDLVHLFFDDNNVSDATKRKRKSRAYHDAKTMHEEGIIVLRRETETEWKILEPYNTHLDDRSHSFG